MNQAFESLFGWFGAGENGTSLLWSADPHIQVVVAAILALALTAVVCIYVPFAVGLVRLGQLIRELAGALADDDPSALPARRGRIDDAMLRSSIAPQWETFLRRWRRAVVSDEGEERAPVRLADVFDESPALPSGARKSLLPALPGLFLAAGTLGALVAIALAVPSASSAMNLDSELRVGEFAVSIEMALRTALWGLIFSMGAAVASRWIEGRYEKGSERLDQLVSCAYGYAPPAELAGPQATGDFERLRGELAQMLDARFAVQAGTMRSLREAVTEMEQAPKQIDVRAIESVAGSVDQAVVQIRDASQSLSGAAREVDAKLEALRLVSASLEDVASRASGDKEARKNAIDLLHELSDGLRAAASEVGQTLSGAGLVGQREADLVQQRSFFEEALAGVASSIDEHFRPIDGRMQQMSAELAATAVAASTASGSDQARIESVASELGGVVAELRTSLGELAGSQQRQADFEAQRDMIEAGLSLVTTSVADRLAPIDRRLSLLSTELTKVSKATSSAVESEQSGVESVASTLRELGGELRERLTTLAEATPSSEERDAQRQRAEEALAGRISGTITERLGPIDHRLQQLAEGLGPVDHRLQQLAEGLRPIDQRLEQLGSDLGAASTASIAASSDEQSKVERATGQLRDVATELREAISQLATAGPSEEEVEARRELVEESLADRIARSMDSRLGPIDEQLARVASELVTVSATSAAASDHEQNSVLSATTELQSVATELRSTMRELANAGPSAEELEAQRLRVEEGLAARVSSSFEQRLTPIDERLRALANAGPSAEELEAQRMRVEEGLAARVSSSFEQRLTPIDEQLQRLGSQLVEASSARSTSSEAEQRRMEAAGSELRDVAAELRAALGDLASAVPSEEDAEARRELVEESLTTRIAAVIGERLEPVDDRLEQLGLTLAAGTAASAAAADDGRSSLADVAAELREVASEMHQSVTEAARVGSSSEDAVAQAALIEEGLSSLSSAISERLDPINERLRHLGSEMAASAASLAQEDRSAVVAVANELGEVALEIRETLSEAVSAGPSEEDSIAQRALIEDALARVQTATSERIDPIGERLERMSRLLDDSLASAGARAEAEQQSVSVATSELREVAGELRETLSEAIAAGEEDSVTQQTLIEEGLTRVSTSIGERLGPIDDRLERMSSELAAAVAATSDTANEERQQFASLASELQGVAGELQAALGNALAVHERTGDPEAQQSLVENAVSLVATSMAERFDPIDERLGRLGSELAQAASMAGANAEQERSSVTALASDLQGVAAELREALQTASARQEGDTEAQLALIEDGLEKVTNAIGARLDPIDERLGRIAGELAEVGQNDDGAAHRALIEEGLSRFDSSLAERFDPMGERLEKLSTELVALAAAVSNESSHEKSMLESVASDLRSVSEELSKSLEPAHGMMTKLDHKTTGFFAAVNDLETHVDRAERSVAELRSGVGEEGNAVREVTHELKVQIDKMTESIAEQQQQLEKSPNMRAARASAEHERNVHKALERARKVKAGSTRSEDDGTAAVAAASEPSPSAEPEPSAPAERKPSDMPDLDEVRAHAERSVPAAVADPEGSRPPGLSSLLSSKRSKPRGGSDS